MYCEHLLNFEMEGTTLCTSYMHSSLMLIQIEPKEAATSSHTFFINIVDDIGLKL